MFCLGTDKIQLGYTILEDGTVLTASQVDEMLPYVSEGSRSGHSSGASSPGVDDPDRYVIQEDSLLSCGHDSIARYVSGAKSSLYLQICLYTPISDFKNKF